MNQVTMSKTDQLLQCSWWCNDHHPQKDSGSDFSRYGVAFHALSAGLLINSPKFIEEAQQLASQWKIDWPSLEAHAQESHENLSRWLREGNPYGVNFFDNRTLFVENSIAWNHEKDTARHCDAPDENHFYNIKTSEFPGTADLIISPPRGGRGRLRSTLLVCDHKTGREVPMPSESGQLKSLALAASRLFDFDAAIVVINHAPKDGTPVVYSDEVSSQDLMKHRGKLREAFAKIGDGSLRPGLHCNYCRSLVNCPTQSSLLLDIRKKSQAIMDTPEEVGRIYEALKVYDEMAQSLKDEIKEWVAENGAAMTSRGSLILVEKSRENLSKASIERGVGKVEAKRIIDKLRKDGCLSASSWQELKVEKD